MLDSDSDVSYLLYLQILYYLYFFLYLYLCIFFLFLPLLLFIFPTTDLKCNNSCNSVRLVYTILSSFFAYLSLMYSFAE